MIALGGPTTKVHRATVATDLRRGYSGLYNLIEHEFGGEPMAGHLWVFANKRRDMVKVFWWDEGGMCILGKRLHEGTFAWPKAGQKLVHLSTAELQLLLSGLEVAKLRPRRWVRPSSDAAAAPRSAKPDGPAAA